MLLKKPSYILLDIEGTTTSISFVHDTLFPYSKKHLSQYITEHRQDLKVAKCLKEAHAIMVEEGSSAPYNEGAVIEQLQDWIKQDRKAKPLKTIQGYIWKDGYEQKQYQSHIYKDVVPSLKDWISNDIELYIYSSGSIEAQKLLFAHTEWGDLRPLIKGYFDTGIGHKRQEQSYQRICQEIECRGEQILFLSDVAEELNAAKKAKLQTAHIVREGTTQLGYDPSFASFDQISFEI